ncbi:MAG: TetR family transcriptional regulator [Alphaproteobacteria bacterium]|nr:TetR family transcriptional regulator [Alphaproteobacteria bacterium]
MTKANEVKSPWGGRDPAEEREAKRDAIIQAAAEVLAENGYHKTSLDAIAARLGISKPTIYYYANNKNDLVAAVVSRALQQLSKAIDGDKNAPALSQLQSFIHRYAEIMTTNYGRCVSVIRDARIDGSAGEKAIEAMSQIDLRIRELLQIGQQDGSIAPCDVKLTAFMIAGAINEIPRWFDASGDLSASVVADKYLNQLTLGLQPR